MYLESDKNTEKSELKNEKLSGRKTPFSKFQHTAELGKTRFKRWSDHSDWIKPVGGRKSEGELQG